MSIIASVNFVVDPGEIYLKKIISDKKAKEFADKLFLSEKGIIQTGWNERLVKTALAKSAYNFDCVILGSSHVMQISSIRNTGNIKDQCNNLLNLAVSGGGIEDIAIFSYLLLHNLKHPRHVFVDIAPWTLKFNMDSRYGAYQNYLDKMNLILKQSEVSEGNPYFRKIILNLFNGEYFHQSLVALTDSKKNNVLSLFKKVIQYPEKVFSYEEGYAQAVTLIDGSHVYSQAYIQLQRTKQVKIGDGDYKITGKKYDPMALNYLKKVIEMYKKRGMSISLIMTPYHPNVFKKGMTKPVSHMTAVEDLIKSLSQEQGIKYYGSFFPNKLMCKEDEFYDFMHPTNKCLSRINFGV